MPHIWSQFGPIIWGPKLLSRLLQLEAKQNSPLNIFTLEKLSINVALK